MKKALKRIFCLGLVLVFMLTSANIAFAIELQKPQVKLSSPKLYAAAPLNLLDFESAVDTRAFNDYLVEQLKLDDCTLGSNDYVEVNISQFKIPRSFSNQISNFVWYNSPELFNIDSMACAVDSSGQYLEYIYFTTNYSKEEYISMHSKMVANAELMLKGIRGNETLSDVEKALLLHDRLTAFCEYDYENYLKNKIPKSSYTAYGSLGLGTSVCMGYTLAYDYLLEQVGIKSEYCGSDVLNHAWNIVYINNTPYHVDVTWDDPVWDVSGKVVHRNFLRSTDGIIETGHNANDFISTPVDTTYDNAFWQSSITAFQIIDNKIYYIDDSTSALYAVNDIFDTTKEAITSVDYKWYTTDGFWYDGPYSKLATLGGKLIYSTPTTICSYNPKTKETNVILNNTDILPTVEFGYNIYGMSAFGCEIFGEFSYEPWNEEETKKIGGFSKFFHNPTENWKVTTAPTTEKEGVETNYCVDCGAAKGTRSIPKLKPHVWGEWVVTKNATCIINGEKTRTCSDCTAIEKESIPPLGHKASSEWVVEVNATCAVAGTKYKKCTVCDAKTNQTAIPATGNHIASGEWIEGKSATCASEGYKYKLCKTCGNEVERQVIAKLPHGATEVINARVATCVEEGYTGDTRCKECRTVINYGTTIAVKPHTISNWIIIENATATTEGMKIRKCTVCDVPLETETIPATPHKFDGGVITIQPTCINEGLKTYTCTVCHAIQTETLAKTGHTEVVMNAVAATCTSTGFTEGKKCSVCNTVIVAQQTTPKISHVEVVIPAVAPTYTTVGKTSGRKCAVCGLVTVAQKDIAKLVLGVPVVKISNSAKGITVTWNAVEGAQSYVVYRRTYNPTTKKYSGWTTLNGAYTSTSYTDTKVVLGTQYSYTVRAVNNGVKSAYKATSGLKYNVTPTVKISNATNGIKVTWTTAANADGYRVYRSTYNSKTKKWSGWKNMGTAKATATSWTDKSVSNNTYYKYTVRAVEGKFLSSYKASSQTRFFKVPTVKIANNASGVKVTWSKISGATSYIVYRSEFVNGKWSSWKTLNSKATSTSYTDKTAKSGTQYRYTVRAVNGSYKSAYVSSSTLLYLAQPKVTVANASNGIKVSWTQSEGATGYTVYSSTYNTKTKKWSSWSNRGTAKATTKSWTDKKAKKGTTYRYTVRAVNGKTASTYKASSSIKR